MKKSMKWFLVLSLLVVMTAALVLPGAAQEAEAYYVLVFHNGKMPADFAAFAGTAGGRAVMALPEVSVGVVASSNPDFATRAAADNAIQSVGTSGVWSLPATTLAEPALDAPTAGDDLYAAYQWDIRRIGADAAWAAGASGSHDTVVAIIDTGVDFSHPDLAPNFVYAACMQIAGPCAPGTFTHWHGTHVAGTVAAAFGGGRAVGVGPNLGLAGYQVFEAGGSGAYDFPIWWAIMDAANQGFEVINMSLGGYEIFAGGSGAASWTAWNRVINYAVQHGVTVVASAGNEEVDVNGSIFHLPGDLPGIINVSATGIQPDPFFPQDGFFDIRAFYSNYGSAVDIAAPGGDCGELYDCTGAPPSGYPYYWYLVLSTTPGGYSWAGGTSMASPHVAGAAALVMDQDPSLSPQQVKAILTRTADNIGSRQYFGHGMLNVYQAVLTAAP